MMSCFGSHGYNTTWVFIQGCACVHAHHESGNFVDVNKYPEQKKLLYFTRAQLLARNLHIKYPRVTRDFSDIL